MQLFFFIVLVPVCVADCYPVNISNVALRAAVTYNVYAMHRRWKPTDQLTPPGDL